MAIHISCITLWGVARASSQTETFVLLKDLTLKKSGKNLAARILYRNSNSLWDPQARILTRQSDSQLVWLWFSKQLALFIITRTWVEIQSRESWTATIFWHARLSLKRVKKQIRVKTPVRCFFNKFALEQIVTLFQWIVVKDFLFLSRKLKLNWRSKEGLLLKFAMAQACLRMRRSIEKYFWTRLWIWLGSPKEAKMSYLAVRQIEGFLCELLLMSCR